MIELAYIIDRGGVSGGLEAIVPSEHASRGA